MVWPITRVHVESIIQSFLFPRPCVPYSSEITSGLHQIKYVSCVCQVLDLWESPKIGPNKLPENRPPKLGPKKAHYIWPYNRPHMFGPKMHVSAWHFL